MSETTSQERSDAGQHESSGRCMCAGMGPRITRMAEAMLPSGEAGAHFRQAQVEVLKGLRALLDQRIQSMSESRHGTKISVE